MRSKLHTVPRTPRQLFPEARRIIEIIEIIETIDIIEIIEIIEIRVLAHLHQRRILHHQVPLIRFLQIHIPTYLTSLFIYTHAQLPIFLR